jgi:hypothetical protein
VVVACSLVLARVPSIRDFDSITPLFSNHTSDIGVTENNRVTLSKSRMEDTQVRNQIWMHRPPFSVIQMGKFENDASHNINRMHCSRTGDTEVR